MKVTFTWHNAGPHTVWGKLAQRLGREPTNEEVQQEMRRILGGGHHG
jgi:DNA-directed RNA polymerase specialized sigma subunit